MTDHSFLLSFQLNRDLQRVIRKPPPANLVSLLHSTTMDNVTTRNE